MMNWAKLWTNLFGTTTWLKIDIGFWVSMGISLLVAVLMVIVFWSMKPYRKNNSMSDKTDQNPDDGVNKETLSK